MATKKTPTVKKAPKRKTKAPKKEPVIERVPVEVPITELQKAKLELLEARVASLVNPLREQITQKYMALANQELQKALKENEAILKATSERTKYINGVLDEIEPNLPEGYAVIMLSYEQGVAQAQYNPQQRGKRLE